MSGARASGKATTTAAAAVKLSVIVPTLNEASCIAKTIELVYARYEAQRGKPREGDAALLPLQVIVADGGSCDGTPALAAKAAGPRRRAPLVLECCAPEPVSRPALGDGHRHGRGRRGRGHAAPCVAAPASRARQMNTGAAHATGEHLLFLHADTELPRDYGAIVARTLAAPGVAAGAFPLRFRDEHDERKFGRHDAHGRRRLLLLRLVAFGANLRSRLLQRPYGDQALFVRRDVFDALGGYRADLPLLEDVEFVRRVRRRAAGRNRVVTVREAAVITSARRYARMGVLRTVLLNQCILLAHAVGVSEARLARWYRGGGGGGGGGGG